MHIAVVLRDRCQPKKCNKECYSYCPLVRNGIRVIEFDGEGFPVISERLCEGCRICIHKCPFGSIKIINLPEELEEDLIHKFGKNGFRLYRLPSLPKKNVIGLVGPNAIGKSTTIKILSGNLIPNFGEEVASWEKVIERFSSTEYEEYFSLLINREISVALKPQYVDAIPKLYKGTSKELLLRVNTDIEKIKTISSMLNMDGFLERDVKLLSGGELQLLTVAATMLTDADVLFFDEPSSYLDIRQRLKIAQVIKEISKDKRVYVIDHDLAILDYIADYVHVIYGSAGSYGIVSNIKSVRNGINEYIDGYLRDENMRIRDWKIEFSISAPKRRLGSTILCRWNKFSKDLGKFKLFADEGEIYLGEIIGILGPNAIGKTTFIKILAKELEPDEGEIYIPANISYKPQYVKFEFHGTVEELLSYTLREKYNDSFIVNEILKPLNINNIYMKEVETLSGGELQLLAIALCLSKEADIYFFDEPSAYLDSVQRMAVSKTIVRIVEKRKAAAAVIDHDVYFIDAISSALIVFSGTPSEVGYASRPLDMRSGMNLFLKNIGITFRRDPVSKRPRINSPLSYTDRKQKEIGEYYYMVSTE